MSAARGEMRELGERLQQLDARCKECQDRERDALHETTEWKLRYTQARDQTQEVTGWQTSYSLG